MTTHVTARVPDDSGGHLLIGYDSYGCVTIGKHVFTNSQANEVIAQIELAQSAAYANNITDAA